MGGHPGALNSLTLSFFRQSTAHVSWKGQKPETIKTVPEKTDQKIPVSAPGIHIELEPFPVLKSPTNGQIWWNPLQNDDSISD